MPSYPGAVGSFVPVASNASPLVVDQGSSAYLFGQLKSGATQLPINETNVDFEAAPAAATVSSIAACIQAEEGGASAPAISIELLYNGAPGAGESIAVQEADTDADGYYITPSATAYTISTFTSNNTARTDLVPTGGKFIRLQRTKGANAVGLKAKITRLA